MNVMKQIEQFIESLFRDETKAQAMIRNPEQTLRDAGLQNATHAQIQTVAATAAPSVAMGGGDPVVGLQRAVANHHGIAQETFAPTFQPQRVIQQETHNDFASHNSIASPTTIVDNSRDLDLNFGDITFGNKTTAVGDGAVAINGNNEGDILSGDGAVKGNNNDVNNGDIKTGDGSAVTLGDDNEVDGESQKVQGDLIQDNKGPVIKDVDTSAGGKDTGTDADGTGSSRRRVPRVRMPRAPNPQTLKVGRRPTTPHPVAISSSTPRPRCTAIRPTPTSAGTSTAPLMPTTTMSRTASTRTIRCTTSTTRRAAPQRDEQPQRRSGRHRLPGRRHHAGHVTPALDPDARKPI